MKPNKTSIENPFYKGKYFIVFYAEDNDTFVEYFDSIREICNYKKLEMTLQNLNVIQVELYRALRRDDHSTTMLNGKKMYVYLIDVEDDEDDLEF